MDNLEPDRSAPPAGRLSGLSRRTAVAVASAGLMAGGLAGGFLIGHAASTADTTAATATPAPSNGSSSGSGSSSASGAPAPGTFHPNEDPAHETGESAAREAQEDAGQMPTVP